MWHCFCSLIEYCDVISGQRSYRSHGSHREFHEWVGPSIAGENFKMRRLAISRKARSMSFLTTYLLPIVGAIAVFALPLEFARADTIRIDDFIEGAPTVQTFDAGGTDNTATNVIILGSGAEFIHFTYMST